MGGAGAKSDALRHRSVRPRFFVFPQNPIKDIFGTMVKTMARHPQPESLAKLKGADKKNPQRYRKQSPKSALPLGKMPDHMSAEAKVVWFELEAYALQGVLTGADRMVMELTAELVAEFRLAPREMPASRIGHMIGCLARLGLTPADRQKLGTDPAPEGNPFNEF